MRGQSEKESLNRIKELAFCHKQRQIKMMLSNEYYELVDDNFLDYITDYILENRNNFYGMVFEDIKNIYTVLHNAKPNAELNNFPDFVFEGGFIEHFKITSSKQTNKGSQKIIEDKNFKNKIQLERDNFKNEIANKKVYGEVYSKTWERNDVEHSYENLTKSLEGNLQKHLSSSGKYNGNKNLKIFLIEYADFGIEMIEDMLKDCSNNNMMPKREQKHFWTYMLSKDKKMLNYLYQFKDNIDYIIYDYTTGFEIIKIDKIKEILNNIPYEYVFVGRLNRISKIDYYTSVVFNFNGENNE